MTERDSPSEERRVPHAPVIARGRMAQVIVRDASSVIKQYHAGLPVSVATAEATRACIAAALGARTPHMLSIHDTDQPAYLCFQRIDAPTLLQAVVLGGISSADAGRRLADAHRELLSLPPRGLLDQVPDLHPDILPFVPAQLNAQQEDRRQACDAEKEQSPVGTRRAHVLCHLDFHPGNLLWDARTDSTWIIDWYDAGWGERELDVAWTALLLRFGRIPDSLPQSATRLARVREELRTAYLRDIMQLPGLNRVSIAGWMQTLAVAWPHRLADDRGTRQRLAELSAIDPDSLADRFDAPEAFA